MAKAMPIQIRGVVYPSARAAAEALGVSPSTIYSAIAQGKGDKIGLWGNNVVTAKEKGRHEGLQKAASLIQTRMEAHKMLRHPGWQSKAKECEEIIEMLWERADAAG